MPAPAVIPAPRAYINAVAVKGFVVELWASWMLILSSSRRSGALTPLTREHQKQVPRERFPRFRGQCPQRNARVHYCD